MKFRITTLFFITFALLTLQIFAFDTETNAQSTQSYTFTRSLRLGSSGADVRELQKVLNSDPDTHVALSGIGSFGQETTYFGALTRKAVIKFQDKYATEILVPSGLVVGNGFVGPNTLKKLNSLRVNSAQNSPLLPTVAPISSSNEAFRVKNDEKIDIYSTDKKLLDFQKDAGNLISSAISARKDLKIEDFTNLGINSLVNLSIKRVTVRTAKAGAQIGIVATGLTGQNDVYFGENYIVRDVAASGEVLLVKVPEIPAGRYSIVVKNENGISNTTHFVVAPERAMAVTVASVSPRTVNFEGTLTITGSGFSATNDVLASFGILRNVPSSDGKTLMLTIAPEYWRALLPHRGTKKEYPIQFVIISDNGVSAMSQFNLSF